MDLEKLTNKARDSIQKVIKIGQIFVVKDLFQGGEWNMLSVGERSSYGRYFRNEVREGKISNVEYVGRRKNNHAEYKKILN